MRTHEFQRQLSEFKAQMDHLTSHSQNQLAQGLGGKFIPEYKYIVSESMKLSQWAGTVWKKSSLISSSMANFLSFYKEVVILQQSYEKNVDTPVVGRGSYDFSLHLNVMLESMHRCFA